MEHDPEQPTEPEEESFAKETLERRVWRIYEKESRELTAGLTEPGRFLGREEITRLARQAGMRPPSDDEEMDERVFETVPALVEPSESRGEDIPSTPEGAPEEHDPEPAQERAPSPPEEPMGRPAVKPRERVSRVPLTAKQAACLEATRRVFATHAVERVTQSAIAREMGTDSNTATGFLRALRAKGYVTWEDGENGTLRLLDTTTPIEQARVAAPSRETNAEDVATVSIERAMVRTNEALVALRQTRDEIEQKIVKYEADQSRYRAALKALKGGA